MTTYRTGADTLHGLADGVDIEVPAATILSMFGFQAQVCRAVVSLGLSLTFFCAVGLLVSRHLAAGGALRHLHSGFIPRIGAAGQGAEVDVF